MGRTQWFVGHNGADTMVCRTQWVGHNGSTDTMGRTQWFKNDVGLNRHRRTQSCVTNVVWFVGCCHDYRMASATYYE